ncbi:SDR family NAD(P)-dependent oxidoreductase [Sphingomonas koreensis]
MTTPLAKPSIVVLTGATSGIGSHLMPHLLAGGHHVVAVSRRASALDPHPALERIDCDLAAPDAVRALAADLAFRYPRIDLLINNAALQHGVPLTAPQFDPDAMIAEAQINLVAPALLAHGLIGALEAAGPGAGIVNLSSGLAYFPKRDTALYCATKAGLHSFSQSLRYQLEPRGIRVIEAILPLVATPMTQGRGSGKMDADAVARAILAGIARGRDEIHIGKARLLPLLVRIAPAIVRRMLRG